MADAVAANPAAAVDLLDAAAVQSVPDLKRTCRDTRHAADTDPDATRRRHYIKRSCRTWSESDGEWKAVVSGPADYGARFAAALRGDHDRTFTGAHAAGRRESDAAYRLDALLAVMERGASVADDGVHAAPSADPGGLGDPGSPADRRTRQDAQLAGSSATSEIQRLALRRRSGRQTKVIVLVDAEALRRGTVGDGETCSVAGVGPVPLSAVKRLIPDAHLAYVIRDGVDTSVAHLGRQATAHQRTALEARGYECAVPTCRSTHLLEIDHVRDWAFSRQTVLDDLDWLCLNHHELKSRKGHRLTGPPGRRSWTTDLGYVLSGPADPGPATPQPATPLPPDPPDPTGPSRISTCRSARRARLRQAGWRSLDPRTGQSSLFS